MMMRPNYEIPFRWIMEESNWDKFSIIAPGDLPWKYDSLRKLGITFRCYDIDPRYRESEFYSVLDPVFDPVQLERCILNLNAQKMYPLGKLYSGEFIIVGSDTAHNGDCNVITSCEQIIEQNCITEVMKTESVVTSRNSYFFVWGRND
jgi:hypothetical protein